VGGLTAFLNFPSGGAAFPPAAPGGVSGARDGVFALVGAGVVVGWWPDGRRRT